MTGRKYFKFGGIDVRSSADILSSREPIPKPIQEPIPIQNTRPLVEYIDIDSFRLIDDTELFLQNQNISLEKQKIERKIERKNEPTPSESVKKKKQAIPKHIKQIVWKTYIGDDIIKHKCLCCKIETITNTNFHCGHVLAEACGGTLEVNNLRPICSSCNASMKTTNMIEYVKRHGLFIG